MHYCGLDVSRTSTHAYIEDGQGRRVKYAGVPTTPTGRAGVIDPYTERGLRVAIEAGNQTAWIVDLLRKAGAKVHVVHPLKVKLIAESKKKTDRIDAKLLAHLLRGGGLARTGARAESSEPGTPGAPRRAAAADPNADEAAHRGPGARASTTD